MKETVLLESLSLREDLCNETNTAILERVGDLVTLPCGGFATSEQVADFYQVGLNAIRTIAARHRDELEKDGYRVLSSVEFEKLYPEMPKSRARCIAVFPRRAILRTGMLLAESEVAKMVRHYLLAAEEYSLAVSTRQSLMEMAIQLREQAEKIAENAKKSSENAVQLISQADIIKAVVEEIYRGKDKMRSFENRLKEIELRFSVWDTPQQEETRCVSDSQIEQLKEKVQQMPGKAIGVWKKFNKHFDISRYKFLPAARFEEALAWLEKFSKFCSEASGVIKFLILICSSVSILPF